MARSAAGAATAGATRGTGSRNKARPAAARRRHDRPAVRLDSPASASDRRSATQENDDARPRPPRPCSRSSASGTSACSGSPSWSPTAGSALTDLAAGIWVYRETGSALAVGLTLMATAVPSLIVGLLAGVYVDRHDRKRILIVTCLVQAVIVALIAVVIGIESIAVVGLYGLILLNAGHQAVLRPGPRQPDPGDGQRRGAVFGQRVPVDRRRSAPRPSGSPQPDCWPAPSASTGRSSSTLPRSSFSAGCIALMGQYPMPVPDEEASVAVIVANLRVGPGDLVRHADHPLAVRRRRPDVLLVRPVERAPAADVDPGARRDRVRVRPPGGSDLGRLRRRVLLHGAGSPAGCPSRPGSSSPCSAWASCGILYGARDVDPVRHPAWS